MHNREELYSKVIEVVVGVVVAALVLLAPLFVPSLKDKSLLELQISCAALLGMMTSVFTAVLLEPRRRHAAETQARIHDLLSAVSRAGDLEHVMLVLKHGHGRFRDVEMPEVWMELLWRMRQRFCGTSYVSPTSWKQVYPVAGIELQRLKARVAGAHIRRIFIVDSIDELAEIKAADLTSSIEIRYVEKSYIQAGSTLANLLAELETIDFGLFDDKYVFLWHLDKQRRLTGGSIHFSKEYYDRYMSFFRQLWDISSTFTGKPMTISSESHP